MNYEEKLIKTKESYPFGKWRDAFEIGLEQYTEENCGKTEKIYDELIAELVARGENASETEKIETFRTAIEALNELNAETDYELIETGEREDLCRLTNVIAEAAGLAPEKYGGSEGLASEWRDW